MNRSLKDGKKLRDLLFKLISENDVSLQETIQSLSEVKSFYLDRMEIEKIIKESGLRPIDFQSNDQLELFYNLRKGRRDIGYVSKGWSEPGFRIGNVIVIPEIQSAALRSGIMEIMKICAVRGFAVTVEEKSGYFKLHIDTVVYSEGLNRVVFMKIMDNLCECVDKICEFLR
jgi:hypothetical protein